jgi:hypothetical protein
VSKLSLFCFTTLDISVVDPNLFFSDPDSDPISSEFFDPDPDSDPDPL